MFGLVWPLLPIIFLAILSGYFSLMQTALTESRHGKIEKLAEGGNSDAKKVLEIVESPEKFLSAAKIGMTLTAIFSGIFIIPLSNWIYDRINFFAQALPTAIIFALILILFVIIFFGVFLPMTAAKLSPENFLLNHYKSFKFISKIFSPIISIFLKISEGAMMIFGISKETSDAVTEDEVKDLIEQGTEDGIFEESEREMVDKIFYLSDQTAYSLMTPRVHMVWLDLLDDVEKNLKIVREHNQNIFPVGEGSLDECRGVIYAKDLLDAALDKKINLRDLVKKPVFIPRTMETFRLVEKFKSSGDQAAIVNDEYGGVIGFITLDDIAQEIVGIVEESKDKQFLLQKNNSWLVDGLCEIDYFKKKFNFQTLPDEERDHFQTMGGFLTSLFGYIPKVGEKKDWNGFRFEVLKMDRARIDKISVEKIGEA